MNWMYIDVNGLVYCFECCNDSIELDGTKLTNSPCCICGAG